MGHALPRHEAPGPGVGTGEINQLERQALLPSAEFETRAAESAGRCGLAEGHESGLIQPIALQPLAGTRRQRNKRMTTIHQLTMNPAQEPDAAACRSSGCQPARGSSSAVGGVMMYDESGDPIGRVYQVAEVCDEIMAEVWP